MKKLVAITSIVIFVFFLNFRVYVYNLPFYEEELDKLDVYDKIPKEITLDNVKDLVSYLKDGQELNNFFNEKEKRHMEDVKYLVNLAVFIFYLTFITSLFLIILFRNNLFKIFLISGILIIILIIIFSFMNFESVFLSFHKVFFNNNLWILDPETDNLINLFPAEFFYDFLYYVFLNSFIMALLLIIGSFIFREFEKV